MSNIEITNNASATIQIWLPIWKNDQKFRAAAAVVYPKGMVLAFNTTTAIYEPYVPAGPDGTGTPSAVLATELDATAGAADYDFTPLIGGEVRFNQLGVSTALTGLSPAEIVALQDYGIITRPINQLGELDNQ